MQKSDASSWATAHSLDTPCVIEFAQRLKDWWLQYPEARSHVALRVSYQTIVVSSDERQRAEDDIRDHLWSHVHESLREWRKHADAAHRRIRELDARKKVRRTREIQEPTLFCSRVDRRAVERKVREKLADWRSLLTRNVQDGRHLLREVLTGPMRFTPENGCFRFEGQADMSRLLQGVIPYLLMWRPHPQRTLVRWSASRGDGGDERRRMCANHD